MVEPLDTKSWVMVPVEPTPEMIEAAASFGGAGGYSIQRGREGAEVWHDMLSAIPSLPSVDAELEAVAWRYLVSDREWEATTEEAKAERLGEIVIVEPLVRKADATSVISSQKQEIEELRYFINEVEQGDKVRDNQIEAAESRVLSLEARLSTASALLVYLQHWIEEECGAEMPFDEGQAVAFAALKVNGNG